jgi:hypothetical protein
MLQPVLTLWAVPSAVRSQVRQAIHRQGVADAAEWFAVVTSTDVSRASQHDTQWWWVDEELQRRQI